MECKPYACLGEMVSIPTSEQALILQQRTGVASAIIVAVQRGSAMAAHARQLAPAGLLIKADSKCSLADHFVGKKSIGGMYPAQASIA